MKRTAFDESRDQRVADDSGSDRLRMCCAHGCPNRWSVDPPRACSAHAWSDPHEWPQITQEQLDAQTNRARWAADRPAPVRLSRAEKAEVMQHLRAVFSSGRNPRQWAHELRSREQSGESLTSAQREAWRAALHAHSALDSAREGAPIPAAQITDALRVTGDLPPAWATEDIE